MSESEANATPLWRFSLHFYRQAGVAEACIALQDGCGVDVNLLLFALWLASQGRRLSADDVRGLDDTVRAWRDLTIIPLRELRRALKGRATAVESGRQEAFRSRIKAVELEAERLQQEALYDRSRGGPLGAPAPQAEAARANVAAYERVLQRSFAKPAVEALLRAFDGLGAFGQGAA